MSTTPNNFMLERGFSESPELGRDRNQNAQRRSVSTSAQSAMVRVSNNRAFGDNRISNNNMGERVPTLALDSKHTQDVYNSHKGSQSKNVEELPLIYQQRMARATPVRKIQNRGHPDKVLEGIHNTRQTANSTLPLFSDGSSTPTFKKTRVSASNMNFGKTSEHEQAQSILAHKLVARREMAVDVESFTHIHSRMEPGKKFTRSYFASKNLGPL